MFASPPEASRLPLAHLAVTGSNAPRSRSWRSSQRLESSECNCQRFPGISDMKPPLAKTKPRASGIGTAPSIRSTNRRKNAGRPRCNTARSSRSRGVRHGAGSPITPCNSRLTPPSEPTSGIVRARVNGGPGCVSVPTAYRPPMPNDRANRPRASRPGASRYQTAVPRTPRGRDGRIERGGRPYPHCEFV